jgi:hypothetical protein
MPKVLLEQGRFESRLADGSPNSNGKLYTYVAGTVNTAKTTYSDSDLTVANTNPIILDAAGSAIVYFADDMKIRVDTADDVTIFTQDNVNPGAITGIVNVLDVATDIVTVVNTVVETNLYNYVVEGGTLGTTGGLRLVVLGWVVNETASSTSYHIGVYYGSTAIRSTTVGNITIQDAGYHFLRVAVDLHARGATNAQVGFSNIDIGGSPAGLDHIPSPNLNGQGGIFSVSLNRNISEDSTSPKNLYVTIKFGDADPDIFAQLISARLEWLS